ncbi:MAG: endonuclease III domain-containing protein [Nanoarchaeota archaeon]
MMTHGDSSQDIDIDAVMSILSKEVPKYDVPVVDLIKIQTNDPFRILLATILSSRTKDSTTAQAAARLFEKVKTFKDLETISDDELEKAIFPVGFYKTKVKNLKKLPTVIDEEFDGRIPKTVDELVKLPGVGRKTANLVSAVAFEEDAICVDTHVHRITNRLGYVDTKTPLETEMALREKLPREHWQKINNLLVAFGQNLCTPISPYCSKCPVRQHCKRTGVTNSR